MRIKTEERKQHILKVASEVFLEAGFERASMAEISARVGGSKATLHSYFPSKSALFVATTILHGKSHADEALSVLIPRADNLQQTLQCYGERILALVGSERLVCALRIVIAEDTSSKAGKLFYQAGPQHGHDALAGFLALEIKAERLKTGDANVMAFHLTGLLCSQTTMRQLLGVKKNISREVIKRYAAAAVEMFMAAYGAGRPETRPPAT